MITKIFSVYDDKVEAFSTPFFQKTTAAGIRAFTQVAEDPTTNIFKYGADYTLFEIGTFEDNTGEIEYTIPKNLGNGLTLRTWPKPVDEEETAA